MDHNKYVNLWHKGQEDFKKIDHNKNIQNIIDNELNNIINFHFNDRKYIKEYQLKKISELVDYAFVNIPLYKEKYSKVGYELGSIKSFKDFEQLPFVYKDELIDNFPDKVVKNIDDFKYSTRSSGSSGKFVTIALDLDAIYIDTVQGIRQFIWQSENNYKKEDNALCIYTCPWWISKINGFYFQDFLPTTSSAEEVIERLKILKPLILTTYPTFLNKICSTNVKLSDYGVKYVITHSEQSTKAFRNLLGDKLNVKVYDEYSTEELTRVALECYKQCYHLEEDACYTEIYNPKTLEKINNGTGIVVGTNLLNHATPIIRYWQGDLVTIDSNSKCECGHNGRILTSIHGREMDSFISNGKEIPASAFMDIAYNWFLTYEIPIVGVKYQIYQESPDKIKVFLQKGTYELSENEIKTIEESLYELVDRNIDVEVIFTDKFIQNNDKFKCVLRGDF